jgi:hypothetical protein
MKQYNNYTVSFIVYKKKRVDIETGCFNEAHDTLSVDDFIEHRKSEYLRNSKVLKVDVEKKLGGCGCGGVK